MTSLWCPRGRVFIVVAALAAALLAAWPGGARAAGAVAPAGSQVWASRYAADDPGPNTLVATSTDGSTVFVTGLAGGAPLEAHSWVTAAYNAATGAQLWQASSDQGSGDPQPIGPGAISFSPSTDEVIISGVNHASPGGFDTIAYSAATGAQLWAAKASTLAVQIAGLAVSPDGRLVYVTGTTHAPGAAENYQTIAYKAATGAQVWVNTYSGQASGIALTPNGKTVLVTGAVTLAYNAATGKQEWVSARSLGNAGGTAVTVNPGGNIAYVAGWSGSDTMTTAYNVATGATLWADDYHNGGFELTRGVAVGVPSSGGPLVVTSEAMAAGNRQAAAVTLLYNSRTGKQESFLQYRAFDSYFFDPAAMVVDPAGGLVYVGGHTRLKSGFEAFGTVALSTAGTKLKVLWRQHYAGPADGYSHLTGLALGQGGSTVYETGTSGTDFATLALAAR